MPNSEVLLEPKDCALVLLDQQAGLAFGVGSVDRQTLLNNVVVGPYGQDLRSPYHCIDLGDEGL
jgi:hypothetical protein